MKRLITYLILFFLCGFIGLIVDGCKPRAIIQQQPPPPPPRQGQQQQQVNIPDSSKKTDLKNDSDGDGVADIIDRPPSKRRGHSKTSKQKANGFNTKKRNQDTQHPNANDDAKNMAPGSIKDEGADDNANDVIAHSNDTILKKAALAVSYFSNMKLGETKSIIVRVAANQSEEQVGKDLKAERKEEEKWSKQNDSTIILTTTLQLYEYLKISLIYDTTDFQITRVTQKDLQKIDFNVGNRWEWKIKAISPNKRQASITLNIKAYTPDAAETILVPHEIPITIYFSYSDMVRGWIRYAGNHPEYTVPSIVVPLLVAIYKRRKKKR